MHHISLTPPARIGDDQVERLDALLHVYAVPNDGMNLEMLDGFFSALAVAPDLVLPSEYLHHVFNREPQWRTAEEGRETLDLVMSLWNDVVARLSVEIGDDDDPSALESTMPLLAFPEMDEALEDPFANVAADYPLGAPWALGFLKAVELRPDAWSEWQQQHEEIAADLELVMQLGVLDAEHAAGVGVDPEELLDFEDRLIAVRDLPVMLNEMNAIRQSGLGPTPTSRGEQPGPDDPCPCGSGKSYKKCCGDPARLN